MDQLENIERRRRNLRIIFFGIIVVTLPFYCLGIILWGSAPQRAPLRGTATQTLPPSTRELTATIIRPSVTPLGFATVTVPLAPTPGQFNPPAILPTAIIPTVVVPPTQFVFPTSTLAPTLTIAPTDVIIIPTNTEEPPTATFDIATPIPIPTDTPMTAPDTDGDGIPDNIDLCQFVPGDPPSGCPPTTDPGFIPPGT